MRPNLTWLRAAAAAVPAAALVYLAFNSGGFFPFAPAVVALVLLVALTLRLTTARNPLAGASAGLLVAAGALALLAVWTLLSGSWSDAPARALLEYNRVLVYLAALVLMGSFARGRTSLAWAVRLLVLGCFAVSVAGLVTWILPELWSAQPSVAADRLAFPLTYWNAQGIVGAIGAVLAFGLATSAREPVAVRLLTAAAMPAMVTTVLFTFSRGSIAAGVAGLVVVVVVGRAEGLIGGVVACGAACGAALWVALGADALAEGPAAGVGIQEGQDVALAVALASVGAAVLRAAALPLDAWLVRRADRRGPRSRARVALAVGLVAGVGLALAAAAGAPAFVERQYDRFVEGNITPEEDQRQRLLNPGNNGRLHHWKVSREAFEAEPLHGTGAGTYELWWDSERTIPFDVLDAHSLYVEVAGELGIVGLALLLVAIGAVLLGFAARARGPDRAAGAALLAAGVVWALHAGIDWDWEMPATTLWLFAAGGIALAAPADRVRLRPPGRVPRVALALGCLVLAVTPALVARSQSKLDEAARAFDDGRCAESIDAALASASALQSRPEPYQLLGYCDVRLGEPELALLNLERARDRDPAAWETWYALALVRGAIGRDPRPAARRAEELNPLEPLTVYAVEQFDTDSAAAWRRRARRLPLPPL
jgi:O-Antigen ligase